MQFTRVSGRSGPPERDPRVYADLDDLIRLQFKAKGFSYLPRQPVHSALYGRHASRLRGRGLNFEELRNYLPGDDIRNVDWKATSRTSRPQVRVFTEERDRPVWLVVDQRLSMFFGSRDRLKSVTAAEAAAVSAWRVLGLGEQELPGAGRFAMSDGTHQIEVDIGRSVLRRGFSEHFQDRLHKMQSLSRKQAIPLLRIGTHLPVLDQVREQLGQRTARRN